MLVKILAKIFGSANDRVIRKYQRVVQKVNELESSLVDLTDDELRNRTTWFKERLAKGESLDDIQVEAFATVREAAKRTLKQRHFDVQLVGGMVLHDGMIAEMKTGEGKTLVATLAVYLNALSGKGVHVVTVNDYLAQRDASWMGQVYRFLGLTVGCIVHGLTDEERREAYACDVTYGTNHEFGFDYLRDNMKFRIEDMVMRPFNYAIVDEVDSILIDEARTPLIISGPAEDSSELYQAVDALIPQLIDTDYEKDEKQRTVMLTDAGVEKIESLLRDSGLLKGQSLYDVQNISLVHHVNQALKAHKLFARDVDYIVKDNKVIIIDEFTGRMMEGRRYSEGLHQALEAKEKAIIEMENQTLASITYQNFFRNYPKLAGMTGTAMTEADEFDEIYKLSVVEIPTNNVVARVDHNDEIYLTAREKYDAIIKQIQECVERKQPVLVGTTSIEKSELMSEMLKKNKISHQVLNARYHEQEALIIADAGRSGAVTIATNMAGRGTDIKLGGNLEMRTLRELVNVPEGNERQRQADKIRQDIAEDQERVKAAGGLFIIGTERHESRRIDNQLRGRSGRQGDPGASKFYLSLEDDLMRIFGSERLDSMLRRLGVQEGEAISHSLISKRLERAQQKVEARNFDIRKHLLRYDDVMNDQRKIIYEQRRELMVSEDVKELVQEMRIETIEDLIRRHIPEHALPDQWDIEGLYNSCRTILALDLPVQTWAESEGIAEHELQQRIQDESDTLMTAKEEKYGSSLMRAAERSVLLRLLDQSWKENLLALDHLRQGINLRAYAQGNPLNEYKREAFNIFQEAMAHVRQNMTMMMSHFDLDLDQADDVVDALDPHTDFSRLQEVEPGWEMDERPADVTPNVVTMGGDARVSRNTPCPCGSGKKFKHCHGQLS